MALFISIKKSQIWSIEFFVGIMIFIGALLIFYKYSFNLSDIQANTLKELIIDSKTILNYLMGEGLPKNWNTSNVISIGLTDGNYRINVTKVGNFSALSYGRAKSLLSVMNDYYVFFEDRNKNSVTINGVEGIGKPGVNKTNLNSTESPSDVIKVFRFAMYNSTIIRMGIYVW